jgi:hypothetical protein
MRLSLLFVQFRPLFIPYSPLLSGIPLSSFGSDKERGNGRKKEPPSSEER